MVNKVILTLDVDTHNLKQNDLLIYKNDTWTNISKDKLLDDLVKKNLELNNRIRELEESIELFKEHLNDRLKEYHNILQTLTKTEE